MNLEKFGFRRVSSNFGEQAIVLEVVQHGGAGNWSILHFNKNVDNYITNEIVITIELYDFLIKDQLVIAVRVDNSHYSSNKYVRCILQLTSKSLIKVL
jgi:hypothetical protein